MAGIIGKLLVNLKADTAQFDKKMRGARKQTQTFGASVKKTAGRLAKFGAVAGGIVVAGIAAMVKNQLQVIDDLGKLSDRLQIATEDLQGFQHAAKISGADTVMLNKALQNMNRRLGEARMGVGEAIRGLEMLGLKADAVAKLGTAEAFREIAEGISKMKDATDKAAAANALFGRQGMELLNTLNLGREGLKKYMDEMVNIGVITREEAALVEEANDSMTTFKASIDAAAQRLTIALAPALELVANKMTDWVQSAKFGSMDVINWMGGVAKAVASVADGYYLLKNAVLGFSVIATKLNYEMTDLLLSVSRRVDAIANKFLHLFGNKIPGTDRTHYQFGESNLSQEFLDAMPGAYSRAREAQSAFQTSMAADAPSERIAKILDDIRAELRGMHADQGLNP